MQYLCKDCGAQAVNHIKTEQHERFVGLNKQASKFDVRGLGGWFCPKEQKRVKVRRTK